jgi:hypothetical protein
MLQKMKMEIKVAMNDLIFLLHLCVVYVQEWSGIEWRVCDNSTICSSRFYSSTEHQQLLREHFESEQMQPYISNAS